MAKKKSTQAEVTGRTVRFDKDLVDQWVQKHGVWKESRGKKRLIRMKNNRPPKPSRRKAIVDECLSGEWENTGQGFVIGSNDQLLDGQNRLMAFHEALEINPQLVFDVFVVEGVDPKAYKKLDGGTPRTLADAIYMGARYTDQKDLYEKHNGTIAQLARYIFLRTSGYDLNSSVRLPTHRIMDFIQEKHPYSLECLASVLDIIEANPEAAERLRVAPVSYWATFLYLASQKYDEDGQRHDSDEEGFALDFLRLFAHNVTGVSDIGNDDASGAPLNHAVGRLYKAILDGMTEDRSLRPHVKFAMIVKAYTAWRSDPSKKVRTLTIKENEQARLGGIDLTAEELNERFQYDTEEGEPADAEEQEDDTPTLEDVLATDEGTVEEMPSGEAVDDEPVKKPARRRAKKRVPRSRK